MLIAAIMIGLIVVAIFGVAATKPTVFRVRRSIMIDAAPDRIFPLINDFRQWAAWSPYEKRDPAMAKTYDGAAAGPGAIYTWSGNGKVGAGRMEILDTAPPSNLVLKLDMIKPMEGHNTVEFTLESAGNATTLTWSMHGPNGFVSRLASVFMNMDHLIGRDFETGLANLKRLAEG